MGLTREQWHIKRMNELYDYVSKHGHKVHDTIYWNTYPICVKDICVLGVAIIGDELAFVDYENDKFKIRKKAEDTERKYLEEVISDMKQLDKNRL